MKTLRYCICFFIALISSFSYGEPIEEVRVIVGVYSNTQLAQALQEVVPDSAVTKVKRLSRGQHTNVDIYTLVLSSSIQQAEIISQLRTQPWTLFVEPDRRVRPSITPNDTQYTQQWHLPAIQADAAWDISGGADCSSVIVAIVDTGVDWDHPDLADNLWINPYEVRNDSVDDDNNGYVDDYYGVDIYHGAGSASDWNGHGTHVAGIIAAVGNNASLVTGLCWSAQIMPVRFIGSANTGDLSAAIEGMHYAINNGAKIINNSWELDEASYNSSSMAMQTVYAEAEAAGVLIVSAAGNSHENVDEVPVYPAKMRMLYDNAVTVANINTLDNLYPGDSISGSGGSNYGLTSVDIAAPGTNIFSLWKDGGAQYATGTSMAAPLTSALAALIWSQEPSLDIYQLKARLLNTARSLPSLEGKLLKPGSIDAYNALRASGQNKPALFRIKADANVAAGQLMVKGAMLDTIDSITLNDQNLTFTALDAFTVLIDLPANAQSGLVQASSLDGSSSELFISIPVSPLTHVQALSADTGVELSWSPPPNADWVEIERAEEGSGYLPLVTAPSSPGVYIDTSVQANKGYRYRLKAFYNYSFPGSANTSSLYSESKYVSYNLLVPELYWNTLSLGPATVNNAYKTTLSISAENEVRFRLGDGSQLPPGISLSESGVISGTPTQAGDYSVTIVAELLDGNWPEARVFSLTVNDTGTSQYMLSDSLGSSVLLYFGDGKAGNMQWKKEQGNGVEKNVIEFDVDNFSGNSVLFDIELSGLQIPRFESVSVIKVDNQSVVLDKTLGAQQQDSQLSWTLFDNSPYDQNPTTGVISTRLVFNIKPVVTLAAEPAASDKRCFIATTVYVNPNDKNLTILRQFRDEVLLSTTWGKAVVDWYYHMSPSWSMWLIERPELKSFVRSGLDVFVWVIANPIWTLLLILSVGCARRTLRI